MADTASDWGPRRVLTPQGKADELRALLRSQLTFGAFAALPWASLSGKLEEWFEKYVYTEQVKSLIPRMRMGQRVSTVIGTDLTIFSVTAEAAMLSKPSLRYAVYRPATAMFRYIVERAFERWWRIAINRGVTAGTHWAYRLLGKAAIASVPYVGWVVNGALVYLDYQLVKETWMGLYHLRDNLIEDIVKETIVGL